MNMVQVASPLLGPERLQEAKLEAGAGGDNPYSQIRQLYQYCCNPMCGSSNWLEIHHIVHRSQGGSDELDNLVLLCESCHKAHHDHGTLRIEAVPTGVQFVDTHTGAIARFNRTPHAQESQSALTDEAFSILRWFSLAEFQSRIRTESREALLTLYDQVREVKHRAWQAQAAIIAELQQRASYGERATETLAEELGVHQRTIQRRGQIYREILSNPDCDGVGETLVEETWYQEAVATDDPVHWINYAADRKAADSSYTTRKLRAEIATQGEETTVEGLVVRCRTGNDADRLLARRLGASIKVPVFLEAHGELTLLS